MTVEAITRKAGPYKYTTGANYTFEFKVFDRTDVYVVMTRNDVETILEIDTDYTVTLNGDQESDPGGCITLLTEYDSDILITLGSDVPYTQETIITNKGGFYPNTLNTAYDKLTVLCQQLKEELSRSVKTNISSSVTAEELLSDFYRKSDEATQSAQDSAQSAQDSAQSAQDSAQSAQDSAQSAQDSAQSAQDSAQSAQDAANTLSQTQSLYDSFEDELSGAMGEVVKDGGIILEQYVEEAKTHAEIAGQRGIPIGTIAFFAAEKAPAGYLVCGGDEVGRKAFPDLFAVIGTKFGEGDGETTFNLPNLINRFAEGSAIPGQYIEAGLPNITGNLYTIGYVGSSTTSSGALQWTSENQGISGVDSGSAFSEGWGRYSLDMDASASDALYGKSTTVQPPALTLLPCIKAFDAAVDQGLVDLAEMVDQVLSYSPAPVGSYVIQFSGMAAPADLYGGTWENISSTFAGLFFRAEGGAAAAFGSSQGDGAPNITGNVDGPATSSASGAFAYLSTWANYEYGNSSGASAQDKLSFSAYNSNSKYGAADEIRPVNSTVRIWKRIA